MTVKNPLMDFMNVTFFQPFAANLFILRPSVTLIVSFFSSFNARINKHYKIDTKNTYDRRNVVGGENLTWSRFNLVLKFIILTYKVCLYSYFFFF